MIDFPYLARFRFYTEGDTKLLRDYRQEGHISVFILGRSKELTRKHRWSKG